MLIYFQYLIIFICVSPKTTFFVSTYCLLYCVASFNYLDSGQGIEAHLLIIQSSCLVASPPALQSTSYYRLLLLFVYSLKIVAAMSDFSFFPFFKRGSTMISISKQCVLERFGEALQQHETYPFRNTFFYKPTHPIIPFLKNNIQGNNPQSFLCYLLSKILFFHPSKIIQNCQKKPPLKNPYMIPS